MTATMELNARYVLQSDERAAVLLSGDLYLLGLEDEFDDEEAEHELILTILHERVGLPPEQVDFRGHFLRQFELRNGESITLIARREGRIVACLVNEVNTSPRSRLLLHPKGGFHLIVHQQRCSDLEEVQVASALNRAVVEELLRDLSHSLRS